MNMNREAVKKSIATKFKKLADSSKAQNAYLLIHSDKLDLHWSLAQGHTEGKPALPEQPYHSASIAKSFTAVIIAMLVEEGKISYSDPIAKYLPEKLLTGLHVYKGKEYSSDITIQQLVSNTSGLPDYFEGKTAQGRFLEIMLKEPTRVWTPEETIEWSKQYHNPRFLPGSGVLYSNTGFNLLGLIIEHVTSESYSNILHKYIFQRLDMDQSYLLHFSKPLSRSPHPVASLNLLGKSVDVENLRSSTSIYAAGQTVSTSEDLLKYMKALLDNCLIPEQSLTTMMQWNKMRIGIDYGYGLMRVRMHIFSPKYTVWGHLGSTGSFMLYNSAMDVHIIGSFNKTGFTGPSVRFVYYILKSLNSL